MTNTTSPDNSNNITLIGDDIYARLKIVSGIKTSLTKPKHQYVVIACDELFEKASTITPEESVRFHAKEYYQIIIRPKTLLLNGIEYSCFDVVSLITWQQKAKLDYWKKKLQEIAKRTETR